MPEEKIVIIKPRDEIFLKPPPKFIDSDEITVNIVEKIAYPPEGGVYVYYVDSPYPKKGAPFPEVVEAMNAVKKALLGLAKFFRVAYIVLPFFLIPKIRNAFIENLAMFTRGQFGKYYLKTDRFCISGRELLKIYNILPTDALKELLVAFVMIWEFDIAYRYRVQDIFGKFNKELFIQNPRREIMRIMEIGASRDVPAISDKWRAFAKLAGMVLLIPSIRRFAIQCVEIIDIDKIELDEDDIFWALPRKDYNFFGLDIETRIELMGQYGNNDYWKLEKSDYFMFEDSTKRDILKGFEIFKGLGLIKLPNE